jgi:Starch-binding associating with outer membrane
MKRIFLYASLTASLLYTGCTKDFKEINTDPTQSSPAAFNSDYFLTASQARYINVTTGYEGAILFQSGWAQIFASTTSGAANYYSNMDKYVPSGNTNDYAARLWRGCYRAASLANEIIKNYGADANRVNVVSAATVMKVLCMQSVADTYGDCPYTEAFQGANGVNLPKYDKQSDVYTAMLTELDAALTKFDANKAKPTADLLYAGDVAKWKKFGYSLMLRLAMRLTKADAAKAKLYAEKAYAGGTFASAADDAIIKGDDANGYRSENARSLGTPADFYQVRWSKSLIDFLKSTTDPRVSMIAEVPQSGLAANQNVGLAGDNSFANQLGLPNGWDMDGGTTDISRSPGFPGATGTGGDATPIGRYSRPRSVVYTDLNGGQFILTYAETELLLAEAAVRGWNVGPTATVHYRNGVTGALLTLGNLNANAAISSATATAYATANPLVTTTNDAALKMINEQYWATTGILMNFNEAWNNWRRSGYPTLTPVVYTGNFSGGTIPRRQIYPTEEASANGANYKIGVASLTGGDVWTARVWWDK